MGTLTHSARALRGTTSLPFAVAVALVRETLKEKRFGVLTEIDVRASLREKLGEELEPYPVLGACSPPDAHRELRIEPGLKALLPCNVAVYEHGGETHVSAVDPVAAEIRARVERAVEKV